MRRSEIKKFKLFRGLLNYETDCNEEFLLPTELQRFPYNKKHFIKLYKRDPIEAYHKLELAYKYDFININLFFEGFFKIAHNSNLEAYDFNINIQELILSFIKEKCCKHEALIRFLILLPDFKEKLLTIVEVSKCTELYHQIESQNQGLEYSTDNIMQSFPQIVKFLVLIQELLTISNNQKLPHHNFPIKLQILIFSLLNEDINPYNLIPILPFFQERIRIKN